MPHRRFVAIAALAAVVAIVVSPLATLAHVNRTAGPYTIVVFLVEEPTYQDNHAGFEFWVRKDDVALQGLEAELHAQAAGHGQVVDLVIDPIDASGFYVVDHASDGAPFDPLGGGDWTLTLTGSIESTQIDLVVPVKFPSYPRVGVASQPSTAGSSPAPIASFRWLIAALVGAAGLFGLALVRRISLRRGR